jgi:hypothetical protein
MPTGALVTVAVVLPVVTDAEAVILVAPAESKLAEFKIIVAMPLPFVNAVAEVGVNATSVLPAAKVTTTPDTAAPLPSVTVAVTVTGVG